MKTIHFLIALMVFGLLTGCASTTPGSHIIGPNKSLKKIDPKLLRTGDEVYHLNARDVVLIQIDTLEGVQAVHKIDIGNQVRVVFTQKQTEQYKITPGDRLTIEFPDDLDAVYELLVNPDGYVTLPKIGKSMKIAGMTLAELNKKSLSQYKNLYLTPNVSWAIIQTFNQDLVRMSGDFSVGVDGSIVLPELGDIAVMGKTAHDVASQLTLLAKDKFKNNVEANVSVARINPRDQLDTRLTPSGLIMYTNLANLPSRISDDGEVYVPNLGAINAQGKTVQELKQEILKKAQPLYQNPITVNVAIQEFADYNVFIGGEVRVPGRYPYAKKLSLLKLIAQAGWGNDTADMGNVLLVRADASDHYTIYRTNLDEILTGGNPDQDFRLTPQDLVIVPPTDIAKTNRMIAQYVRGVLPFSTGVSYNINTSPNQTR